MSQRLVMTPSLQQAIKLLQMSKLELVEEVQQELLENPVLEESQIEDPPAQEKPGSRNRGRGGRDSRTPSTRSTTSPTSRTSTAVHAPRPARVGEELPTFENTLAKPTNLADHLIWQLDIDHLGERHKEIGRAIIGNINDDGYLRATLEEIQHWAATSTEEVRDNRWR